MCGVVAAVTVVTALASAAVQVQQDQTQRKAAKAQNKAADIQFDIETKRAKDEAMARQSQLSQDALVAGQQMSQERQALAREALREKSGQRIASAESGVSGVSSVRSFLASELSEDLARSDLENKESNTFFNLNQRTKGIAGASIDRQENAFLSRQSNRKKISGGLATDIGGAVLNNAGSFVKAGVSVNDAVKTQQSKSAAKSAINSQMPFGFKGVS